MSAGDNRHYRIDEIKERHFIQTARRANLPQTIVTDALEEIRADADKALATVLQRLPTGFPETVHASVGAAVKSRLSQG
jgi:serine/threonine-protein kinase HipA